MKQNKLYDIVEITDELKDYQRTIQYLELEMNVVLMYQAFYQQHKQINGTFRNLKTPLYHKKMQKRYDYIFCRINETIECKLKQTKQR